MNNSLYKISAELNMVERGIENSGGEIETTDELALAMLTEELTKKADGVVEYFKSKEALIEVIDNRIKEFQNLKRKEEMKLSKFNEYVVNCMDMLGKTKIEGVYSSASIRKPSTIVNITDETLIPVEYVKSKLVSVIDKAKIKADFKNGKEIDGANLALGKRKATFKI